MPLVTPTSYYYSKKTLDKYFDPSSRDLTKDELDDKCKSIIDAMMLCTQTANYSEYITKLQSKPLLWGEL